MADQKVSVLSVSDVEKVKLVVVTPIWGHALTVTAATTPKVLPPPPRNAQNKSGCSVSEAVIKL